MSVSTAATSPGSSDTPLPLPAERYHLFHAINLLERLLGDGMPLGYLGPPAKEQIRLRPNTALAFPATDLAAITWQKGSQGRRALVTTNLLGLYGATSPLPRSYAREVDLLCDDARGDDQEPAMRQFLDIFHHRLLSLLYRCWRQYHFERAQATDGSDALSQALLALAGLPVDLEDDEIGTAPWRLLRYLSLFLVRGRPLSGLQALLSEELGLPLVIEQAPARVIEVSRKQGSQLRSEPRSALRLGHDVLLGTRRSDRSTSLRLHIGPVPYGTYLQMLPGGELHSRLVGLVRIYVRQPLDLLFIVKVQVSTVVCAQLGGEAPARLGTQPALGCLRQDPVLYQFESSLTFTTSQSESTHPPR